MSPETRFSVHGSRDSGNKIAASAHGMGSGCLPVDAMVIGCLGWSAVWSGFSYSAIFAGVLSIEYFAGPRLVFAFHLYH